MQSLEGHVLRSGRHVKRRRGLPGDDSADSEELAMLRSLCLTRQCLGLITRIECVIRPLSGDNGMWTLLFAAGMSGEQPSAIKAQGPFHGALAAESVLLAIAESLALHGYQCADDVPIWSLHLQGELRRLNANVSHPQRSSTF